MASFGSKHLKDIDEKFCQCPICLQQYREPKQLPCLHRYCSECLKQLLERSQGVIAANCPECRDEFTIPREGVDGFKTDFYMKNIIEYIQIQKSLEDEQLRECYDCSKNKQVIAYCFKCPGFLCKECHNNHIIKRPLKDHKHHTVSLDDLKSKYMTFEKLAGLKEAPRCDSHPEDLCRLCCRTCGNLPICVTCTYGSHKNHVINDVGIIAAEEAEKLKNKLKNLNQSKERLVKMPEKVDRVTAEIISNVEIRKENFAIRFEEDIKKITKEMKKTEDVYKVSQTEIENKAKRELIDSKKQMDEEMKQVNLKYDNIFEEIKKKCRKEIEDLQHKQAKEIQEKKGKLMMLEETFQTFTKTLEKKQEDGLLKLQEILQQINGLMERYDNLTATGRSVLDTRNDWTTVLCIPDICKAIEPLSEDMKREFPEIDVLSRIEVNPEITEDENSPVNIEEITTDDMKITGITDGGDGRIVIAGYTSVDCQSHITVIDIKGKVWRRRKLKGRRKRPDRYCVFLSKLKVATVCHFNEIGICDISEYSYFAKNISDVISSWPVYQSVSTVAFDPVNNHILVGGDNSRDVYIFDSQLNYQHTLRLPGMIKYPYDMSTSESNLLVCDYEGKKAYVVAMDGLGGKLIQEFTKPNFDRNDWGPISVCTDSKGLIYILWTVSSLLRKRCAVAQYTQDGRQLLTTKQIDANDARCIAAIKIGKIEKLLVASLHSGKLFVYSLT